MTKSEFLHELVLHNRDIVTKLRNTYHSYNEEYINPHHIEDDCWSHTLLVLHSIKDTDDLNYNICQYIAAISHDIGKIHTRKSHKPGKINFWGHANASVQYTAELCKHYLGDSPDFISYLNAAVFAVGRHIVSYETELGLIPIYFNNNKLISDITISLLYADIAGQFGVVENLHNKSNSKIDTIKLIADNSNLGTINLSEMHNADVVMYCGVPGCGKDYLAKKCNRHIVSLDNIRVKKYLTNHPKSSHIDNKDLYFKAFNECKQLDLQKDLVSELEYCRANNLSTAVCNTHTTAKSRSRTIQAIKRVYGQNATIDCRYVFQSKETLIERDTLRYDHSVGKNIIEKFLYNQEIPIRTEGFDNVIYIWN
jgi:hypothetical protein